MTPLPIRALLASLAIAPILLACGDPAAGPTDDPAPPDADSLLISGRLHAPAGFGVEGLTATWRTGGAVAGSGPVATDGSFGFAVAESDSAGELDIQGGPRGDLHPFAWPLRAPQAESLAIVMVPRRWTVRSGIYQGQTVTTSLDLVMDDDADQLLYSYFFGQPEPRNAPSRYRVDPLTWPLDALPARVAFDHAHGAASFTAGDSAAIWTALDRMEEVFRLDLFTPAEADPAWWPDPFSTADPGFVPGVIRVIYDPPQWGALPLGGEAPRTWEGDLGAWAGGGRFTAFRVNQQMLDGGVLRIGALDSLRLADGYIPWSTVLMHETLHVLGVGHTCRMPSPQGPCDRTAEPSALDVAYTELLREIIALEREHGTTLGLMPALAGERTLVLGRPPLPELPAGN